MGGLTTDRPTLIDRSALNWSGSLTNTPFKSLANGLICPCKNTKINDILAHRLCRGGPVQWRCRGSHPWRWRRQTGRGSPTTAPVWGNLQRGRRHSRWGGKWFSPINELVAVAPLRCFTCKRVCHQFASTCSGNTRVLISDYFCRTWPQTESEDMKWKLYLWIGPFKKNWRVKRLFTGWGNSHAF